MADASTARGWSREDVVRATRALERFGLPAGERLSPGVRERLATLVASSAADARPPLDSPRRFAPWLAKRVKGVVRRVVWSRTGAPLERQAELNLALIHVLGELAAGSEVDSDSSEGGARAGTERCRAGS